LFGLEKRKLDLELKKLSEVMTFSSIPLATELGLEAVLPFLEPHVKNFALHLDSHYKIREENGQPYGKWILRKTYERLLPKAIVWRVKTPIEVGAGTTILPTFFNQKLSDTEFQEKRERYQIEDHVTIRDKEQLFYYEIYRSILKIPPPLTVGDKTCPYCQSPISKKATYCRICGAYPI
jgi:asparagine synthase (glutamine-hydrolysing)